MAETIHGIVIPVCNHSKFIIMSADITELWKLAEIDFDKLKELPMAVYITAENGVFVDFNETAEKIFLLQSTDRRNRNISEFYENKKDRKQILEELKSLVPNQWLSNQTLRFKIKEESETVIKSLRFFSKPYFNSERTYLGSICLVFEITELERFRELNLEDLMPIGIFEVADEHIRYANKAFGKLVKNTPQTDLTTRTFKSFFRFDQDYYKLIEEIQTTKEPLKEQEFYFKCADRSSILVRMNIIPEFRKDKLICFKGLIQDVTYEKIKDEAPIGLYMVVRNHDQQDIFTSANLTLAKLLGYTNVNQLVNLQADKFFKSSESYVELRDALREAHKKNRNGILSDKRTEIITGNNQRKDVIITTKYITHYDKIIGTVGVVYDITDDLKRILRDAQKDYASFFHTHSSVLVSLRLSLNAIIRAHGADALINKKTVDIDKALYNISQNINSLRKVLSRYLNIARERNALLPAIEKNISLLMGELENIQNENIKEATAKTRNAVKSLRDIIVNRLGSASLPKEDYKEILNYISEILRFAKLISLAQSVKEITESLLEIQTFKEALTVDNNRQGYIVIDAVKILSDVIASLTEYARSRNLNIVLNSKLPGFPLHGHERDLYIAFYNLLHNAIKYSYTTKKEERANVLINVTVRNEALQVEIENRGVAIRRYELDNNIIYTFGNRGASSGDRERPGSGIGLWHTKKILEEGYQGKIDIDSVSIGYNREDDYSKPFKTTVKISLPSNLHNQ